MSTPTLLPYAERNKPYTHAVYFDGPDGSRKRRKFETRKAALGFLTDKECEYENLGKSIASNVDDSLKRDAHRAQQLLAEFGATLEEAAAHYQKHLLATSRSGPVSTLIAEFLAVKVQNGRSGRHISDLRSRLGEFAKKFGDRFAADIQTEEVETWLLELPGKANATRNHFRSKVHSFFAWCKRKKKCATNPVTEIDKCDVPPTTCEIYSAAEMRLLLRAVTSWKPLGVRKANAPISQNPEDYRHRTDDVLANLVICGFAGLRQSEFERMTWEMVKLDRSKIDLPPEITKTKKRKLVTIRPVLREWLLRYFRGKTGPIMQTNFCNRLKAFKRYLKREHHLAWLHNGMRHSFASHLLEETQDPGHVALELGHRGGVGVLWDHYAERVGKEDAADYWKSTPEAVAEVAGGLVPFEAKAGAA